MTLVSAGHSPDGTWYNAFQYDDGKSGVMSQSTYWAAQPSGGDQFENETNQTGGSREEEYTQYVADQAEQQAQIDAGQLAAAAPAPRPAISKQVATSPLSAAGTDIQSALAAMRRQMGSSDLVAQLKTKQRVKTLRDMRLANASVGERSPQAEQQSAMQASKAMNQRMVASLNPVERYSVKPAAPQPARSRYQTGISDLMRSSQGQGG